jgi:hypothetical protein
MYLKYTRNTIIQTPNMSPKGRRPTTRQNRAQKRGEPRTNLNQTTPSLRQTHIGPLKRSKGVNPPKLGEFGLTGGAAVPGPISPKLCGLPFTASPWSIAWVWW